MANERLRRAIRAAGLTVSQLSEQVEVDPKTVERWIYKDRLPHHSNRQRVARAVGVEESAIWPDLAAVDGTPGTQGWEIVRIYESRGSIPAELWVSLLSQARRQIDIAAFAGSFLFDAIPHFVDRLNGRAAAGVQIRLLFGDPDSGAVAIRGEEEGIGESLGDRCRLTWKYLQPLSEMKGIEMRAHSATLYQSVFRFDDEYLVNLHHLGAPASASPTLHLRTSDGSNSPLIEATNTAWDARWFGAVPPPWPPEINQRR